jgi:hypothetical protein
VAHDLAQRIRSRCYWRANIRPDHFNPQRIGDYARLDAIVRDSAVSLRGWDYPHVGGRTLREAGTDWIGETIEWDVHHELWRFYQSGNFLSLSGLWYDWRDPSTDSVAPIFPFWDTLWRFTEIFEFAARLASTEAGDDEMRVEITIGNIGGRQLYQDDPRKTGFRIYHFPYETFEWPLHPTAPIRREELTMQPRELALTPMHEMMQRFGFAANRESLRAYQQELDRRR